MSGGSKNHKDHKKTESSRRSVRDHLDEVAQQQNVLLPLAGGLGLSPASSYGSIARSSSAAPTNYYIGDSPTPGRGSAQSVHSSPQTVRSSPQVVDSSPQVVDSSPESSFARTEGEYRSQRILNQRIQRRIDFA